jgi:hypothetical protein
VHRYRAIASLINIFLFTLVLTNKNNVFCCISFIVIKTINSLFPAPRTENLLFYIALQSARISGCSTLWLLIVLSPSGTGSPLLFVQDVPLVTQPPFAFMKFSYILFVINV